MAIFYTALGNNKIYEPTRRRKKKQTNPQELLSRYSAPGARKAGVLAG